MDRQKKELRARQRALRAEAFRNSTADTFVRAARLFIDSIALPSGGVVAGYWPLRDEFDPRPLLELLSGRGAALALPVVDGDCGRLVFRQWRPGAVLCPAGHGTMGPEPGTAEVLPDVLIVPFLAFDRRGFRLGYGGGYYDRTLAALRAQGKCKAAIGLGFSVQRVPQVPVTADDARLDAIVTEEAVIWARGAANS